VDSTGVIKDALGESGFAGVDVGGDAHVAELAEIDRHKGYADLGGNGLEKMAGGHPRKGGVRRVGRAWEYTRSLENVTDGPC
jgi:hypothetical protein